MHLTQISFCDRTGYNIRSDDDKARILEELEKSFGVRVLKKHHDAFTPNYARIINTNPFMASVRTNGNPYLMFLTRVNFIEQCVFIDKKIQHGYHYPRMVVTKLWFDPSLFNNTLFEGEMVKRNDGSWAFIINDLLADCGHSLINVNLVKRINRVYELLKKQHVVDPLNVCELQVKRYVPVTQVPSLIEDFVPSLDYTCRGVYFKPLFLKFKDVLVNFDDSLIKKVVRTKYKEQGNFLLLSSVSSSAAATQNAVHESSCTTVSSSRSSYDSPCSPCSPRASSPPPRASSPSPRASSPSPRASSPREREFYVRKGSLPDIYELYDTPNDVSRHAFHDALVPNLKASKALRAAFMGLGVTDTLMMTCTWHDKFSKWMLPLDAAVVSCK